MSIIRPREREVERPGQAEMPTIDKENDLDQLFRITDANTLKQRAFGYLKDNRESEERLIELAVALQELQNKTNGNKQGRLPVIDVLRKNYEALVPSAKRPRIPFSSYLAQYLTEAFSVSSGRFEGFIEANLAREAEQEKRKQNKETQSRMPGIREEWLCLMKGRKQAFHFERNSGHLAMISDFETKLKKQWEHQPKEERERLAATHEQELLLGFIIEKEGLFGDQAKAWPTDKYDDYFNHVDLAVQTENGPTILVDFTNNLDAAGKKLHYNQQHPVRFLEYPADQTLKNKPGIPVVIGITEIDAMSAINQFLESEARARLMDTNADNSRGGHGRGAIAPESMARWVEYLLIQLKHQQNYILKYARQANSADERASYKEALVEYDKAIGYFNRLKIERYPQVKLDEQRSSWDKKFMALPAVILDYEQREGLEEYSSPVLPRHLEVS